MYLHKTKNGHYTPPCCYFSGELEVVKVLWTRCCWEAKGIECEPIRFDTFTGKRMTFFKDPDGLPLELHE